MMELWNWIVAHPGEVSAGVLVLLKWIYNAWLPTGVTFPQFIRGFIGEVIQEAPAQSALSTLAAPERRAVLLLRAGAGKHLLVAPQEDVQEPSAREGRGWPPVNRPIPPPPSSVVQEHAQS